MRITREFANCNFRIINNEVDMTNGSVKKLTEWMPLEKETSACVDAGFDNKFCENLNTALLNLDPEAIEDVTNQSGFTTDSPEYFTIKFQTLPAWVRSLAFCNDNNTNNCNYSKSMAILNNVSAGTNLIQYNVIASYLESDVPETRLAATTLFSRFLDKPHAEEYLRKRLGDDDPRVVASAIQSLSKMGATDALGDVEAVLYKIDWNHIGLFNEGPRDILISAQKLAISLMDKKIANMNIPVLATEEQSALAILHFTVEHFSWEKGSPIDSQMAIDTMINKFGDAGFKAVAAWSLPTEKNQVIRSNAIRALGNNKNPAAIAFLTMSMQDDNNDIRDVATSAMATFGEGAVRALEQLLKDPKAPVRESAASAIYQIASKSCLDGNTSKTVSGLLKNDDWSLRSEIYGSAISKCGPDLVMQGLKSLYPDVRKNTVEHITEAFASVAAIRLLIANIKDNDKDTGDVKMKKLAELCSVNFATCFNQIKAARF